MSHKSTFFRSHLVATRTSTGEAEIDSEREKEKARVVYRDRAAALPARGEGSSREIVEGVTLHAARCCRAGAADIT